MYISIYLFQILLIGWALLGVSTLFLKHPNYFLCYDKFHDVHCTVTQSHKLFVYVQHIIDF